ncbi:MAG: hypothetical protein KZQ83_11650 [gamma proteobacterium symbiont of Taylorina sp.]|nr:hypothetical protein [gamma proteobacterium symbiont of Taylorina sp.]
MSNYEISTDDFKPTKFKTIPFVFSILIIILFISQAIQWYSRSVTLPRFCEDPQLSLHHLQEIITQQPPHVKIAELAGREARKPYIIAAKLIYIIPQKANESIEDYIHRVHQELSQRCMR